jgi:hypothetical protein
LFGVQHAKQKRILRTGQDAHLEQHLPSSLLQNQKLKIHKVLDYDRNTVTMIPRRQEL